MFFISKNKLILAQISTINMKAAILFGRSGYVFRFLLEKLLNLVWFDNYIVCDIAEEII